MTQYNGSDKNIQRKLRRFWQYLKTNNPEKFKELYEGLLPEIVKAIFIAIDEDFSDFATSDTVTGIISIDNTTDSLLDPVPYDKDV